MTLVITVSIVPETYAFFTYCVAGGLFGYHRQPVKKLWLLLLPVIVFFLLAIGFWFASFQWNSPAAQTFKDNWALFAQMGSTFQGLGSLFVAIAVGVSFITYNESSKRLLQTAQLEAQNLSALQKQAAASVLMAKVDSLTSRLQGYEAQIAMIRAQTDNSMTVARRTEENSDVRRMRGEQHHLYLQLDRVLDDLKVGTQDNVPPAGSYSDPFAESEQSQSG